MTQNEIFETLKNRLIELFEVSPEKVTWEASLRDDLGLDSIDAVDMAVELQKITGKRVDFESLRTLETIRDVVVLVESYLAEKSAS